MGAYRDVQFIGYAIPTIPLDIGDVGGPNDDYNFIEGRYIGIESPIGDIDARVDLVMSAARQTLRNRAIDGSASTLKIFVVPEFSCRGRRGAYNHDPPGEDPFVHFRERLAQRAADPAFQGWLFVIGTFLSTAKDYIPGQDPARDREARVREDLGVALGKAWQLAHRNHDEDLAKTVLDMLVRYTGYSEKHPLYEIRNRCYVVPGGAPSRDYPDGLSVEKKYLSPEDFVLNLYTNIFAQEDVDYPPVPERDGEDKETAFDDLGIFTIEGVKCGVELCFDHSMSRLRRNRRSQTECVQIHLVPSCGMQLIQRSIIACAGGLVFNCDGQYGDRDVTLQPDAGDSLWTASESDRAHSQLAQVRTACVGNDPKSTPATLVKPDATVTVIPIEDPSAKRLFAYGAGEVHVYTPLPLPSLP